MNIKEIKKCPKCNIKPIKVDIVKIYNEKIGKEIKKRVRCRNCAKEFIIPYIKKEVKKKL